LDALHSGQLIASQKHFTLSAFDRKATRAPFVWLKRAATFQTDVPSMNRASDRVAMYDTLRQWATLVGAPVKDGKDRFVGRLKNSDRASNRTLYDARTQ
jgi:hypothetical protein